MSTYDPTTLHINGVPVDAGDLNYSFDRLNEVVDFARSGLAQSFTEFFLSMRAIGKGFRELQEALGMHSRSNATVATLEKRAKYNNRKGLAARRKLA